MTRDPRPVYVEWEPDEYNLVVFDSLSKFLANLYQSAKVRYEYRLEDC